MNPFFRRTLKVLAGLTLVLALLSALITNPVIVKAKGPETPIPADSARLRGHVEALCGTSEPRDYKHMKGLNEAADYIRSQFEGMGYEVEEQTYTIGKDTFRNIMCSYGPADGERIVVGAHYDVYGGMPGADDNASGVAGLLETARLLQSLKPEVKYRIDLVAYTLEEPEYFRTPNMGSARHARMLKEQGVELKGMICLEMIGYYSDEKGSQGFPVGILKLFYPDRGNFITVVGKFGQWGISRKVKKNMRAACDIKVKSINAPVAVPGIDFSDHLNYWKEGYKAVMVTNTAFYRNHEYHQPNDTPGRLNYHHMAEVVKGVYYTLVNGF